jgi:Uma2 family endonuclease
MVTATTLELENQRPLTADDLKALPDDGNRYEIIGGELYVSPSPTLWHQVLSVELTFALKRFLSEQNVGRILSATMDVHLSQHDVVEPDLLVILNDNLEIIQRGPWIEGAPDLIVEILSPSSIRNDWVRKSALYALVGVKEYWIVDTSNRSVVVQSLVNGQFVQSGIFTQDTVLRSPLLEGFELKLQPLFAELDILNVTLPEGVEFEQTNEEAQPTNDE